MSLANALIVKKPIITYYTETILNTLGVNGIIYFKKFEVAELRNIINKKIFKKNNFKKLNTSIIKNKRYLLILRISKEIYKLI